MKPSDKKSGGFFVIFNVMTKLDEILTAIEASNHDLVEMDAEHLNHKMVQKARLGKKPVPRHTQDLILNALNRLLVEKEVEGAKPYKRLELFGNEQMAVNSEQ
ncbi:hypothetical protein SAMN05720766_102113 [Fibrobacter sp. UWH9]|nr:hypothetical protein [Fibrobacter succinogenes]SHG48840.1 hypothetical protein SAMN05720766_102113 [Fibrobacter sp. UWH9]SHK27255.1 hypothetical protein SAMN05720765_101372 [Fibrobacter sp. UWH6]SHK45513.1 hypothetical protein SAMN05720764_101465 [Fibrobacter sp. UWH5]